MKLCFGDQHSELERERETGRMKVKRQGRKRRRIKTVINGIKFCLTVFCYFVNESNSKLAKEWDNS